MPDAGDDDGLAAHVGGVLRRVWDPIGLGACGPADEYDAYVPDLLALTRDTGKFEDVLAAQSGHGWEWYGVRFMRSTELRAQPRTPRCARPPTCTRSRFSSDESRERVHEGISVSRNFAHAAGACAMSQERHGALVGLRRP